MASHLLTVGKLYFKGFYLLSVQTRLSNKVGVDEVVGRPTIYQQGDLVLAHGSHESQG
jgi:hypothetical protein